jgi:hypothetical protein
MLAGRSPQLADALQTAAIPLSTLTPIPAPHVADAGTKEEIAMIALTEISRTTQRVVCMVLSAVIVTASLSAGALMVESAATVDYSVTVTQLS